MHACHGWRLIVIFSALGLLPVNVLSLSHSELFLIEYPC
uniref:Uncharacterized protein n=1 Tax=Rhizophora mucronata TaxID=61149 RepID=A0A2P2KKB9_RHIMU